ncbi:VOC family protein [Nocardiopsis ganjiahuensis]|uniref:glyoxalase n=1 Tax=Nocardiopsis ganjiahuensis TaxID=239984 RepID=UPI00059420A3|nr:glyoxalase [Nocardiopsis ganjiahuensis]
MTSDLTSIETLILDVADPGAAGRFYSDAFGLGSEVTPRAAEPATSGFRGFTISMVVSQPSTVDSLVGTALEAGATVLNPVARSLWGYGGSVRTPDGAICTIASSSKKDTGPATREIDDLILQLGVTDVTESKKFYVGQGLAVANSFGGKYVQFASGSGAVKLALYKRKGLAKVAGVAPEGTGSPRLTVGNDTAAFTDPDGFAWEAVRQDARH